MKLINKSPKNVITLNGHKVFILTYGVIAHRQPPMVKGWWVFTVESKCWTKLKSSVALSLVYEPKKETPPFTLIYVTRPL